MARAKSPNQPPAPIVYDQDGARNPQSPPPLRRKGKPRYTQLPPDDITTKPIRPDQAKALAITRRHRIGEVSLGAFIAVAPGAAQTIIDWVGDRSHAWPSPGHLIEVIFAIMSASFLLRSLLDFSEPTSRDELENIFPELGKETSYVWRIGMMLRRLKSDFYNS